MVGWSWLADGLVGFFAICLCCFLFSLSRGIGLVMGEVAWVKLFGSGIIINEEDGMVITSHHG